MATCAWSRSGTDPVDGSLLVPWALALALALMLIGAWSLARFVTDRL